MPTKGSGPGVFHQIDQFDGGIGWIAYPEETMERAGHVLVEDGDLWLIDPVDTPDLDDQLAELGEVVGVAVLFTYHRRDAAAIANRHGVPVSVPEEMTWLEDDDVDAPVDRIETRLGTTNYELRLITDFGQWQEWALYDGSTLVVPESVGSGSYFVAPGERIGVGLIRRLFPPRGAFDDISPERILCGHGEGVFTDAAGELQRALAEARRTAPGMYRRHLPTLLRNLYVASRD